MGSLYPTVDNYPSSTGAMPMLFALRDSIPYAFDGLLLIIFFVFVAAQYFIIKNRTGRGKMLTCLLSSSILMTTLSLFLALAQLVVYMEVVFYAFLSIVFFALYNLSDYW